ncbi:transglutaminase-like domain-containing protein [Pseudolysinimonas sp.]|jgi:hypothetical protein|uniref:transglutaminase-like domain-containing protein n=1 Tax=Pseudolysinimonas sp. TaxID=2680009 RepID=UPI0037840A9B
MSRGLLLWGLLYLLVGVALATASAWEIYRTPRLVVVAAVAAALGIGVVLLVRALRWRGWAIPALVGLGYLLLVVPVAIPSALSSPVEVLRGVRDGVVGIVVGWKQVLTLSLPLGEYQAVLVPFFVLVVTGTALASYLISREGPGTAGAAGVVVALSAFGIVFGGSTTGAAFALGDVRIPALREVLLGVVLVLASVVWLVGRARLRRAAALRAARAQSSSVRQGAETFALRLRRQIAAVLLVAIALASGLAFAPLAQSLSPRQALRDDVDPLVIVRQQPSPLAAYRTWFTDGGFEAELFGVSGGSGVDRLRIATLDSYDGDQFRVSAGESGVRYVRLPGGGSGGGSEVRISIGDGYRGIWLPVPDGVTRAPEFAGVRAAALADGFYLDAASGSAIDTAAAPSPTGAEDAYGVLPGDSYVVVAGADEGPTGFSSEPGAAARISADDYPQLAGWVERQAAPRTGAGLAELVDRLRERGYLSHSVTDGGGDAAWIADLETRADYVFQGSRSGHSAARIEQLFADLNVQEQRAGSDADPDALVAAVGDDEQFAVAAALIARYLGFESRVVIGVRLTSPESSPGIPACAEVCTGSNVSAWIEVRSATGGWTPFDVTPQYEVSPLTITDGEKLPENPTALDQVSADPLDPPQAQRDDSESPDEDPSAAPAWWEGLLPILAVVGTVALTLLLLLLPVLVLAIAKVVRRRSRRDALIPEVSMVGAWTELVDGYVDLGFDVPDRVSRSAAAQAVGRPRAVALAAVVDRAVFAEHPPERSASTASWRLVDDERRELAAAVPWTRRLLAAIAPASFLRELGATRATLARRGPLPRKASRP